jgi:hypothetical protein
VDLQEYGPLDALLIGAGAATDSAIDQSILRALAGAEILSGGVGYRGGEDWAAIERTRRRAEMAENARLYEHMRRAFPYLTSAGESLPAIAGGLRGLTWQTQMNLARSAIDQAGQRTQHPLLLRIAQGLRRL